MWRGMVGGLDGGQHVTTSLLIDLPLPGEGVQRPGRVGVLGNVLVTLVRGGERRRNGVSASLFLLFGGNGRGNGEWG